MVFILLFLFYTNDANGKKLMGSDRRKKKTNGTKTNEQKRKESDGNHFRLNHRVCEVHEAHERFGP